MMELVYLLTVVETTRCDYVYNKINDKITNTLNEYIQN